MLIQKLRYDREKGRLLGSSCTAASRAILGPDVLFDRPTVRHLQRHHLHILSGWVPGGIDRGYLRLVQRAKLYSVWGSQCLHPLRYGLHSGQWWVILH